MEPEAFADELRDVRALGWNEIRAWRLVDLASRAPAEQQTDIWLEALAAARETGESLDGRNRTCQAVLMRLPTHLRPEALDAALDAARQVSDDVDRAEAVAAVAARWPVPVGQDLLDEAVDIAQSTEAEAAARARKWWEGEPTDGVFALWRERSLAVFPRSRLVRALSRVAAFLPPGQREPVLQQARTIADHLPLEDRVAALGEIAVHLPAEQRAPVLTEALLTALTVTPEDARARVIHELFRTARYGELPADQVRPVLLSTLAAAARAGPASERLFEDLRYECPPEFLASALGADLPDGWLARYGGAWEWEGRAWQDAVGYDERLRRQRRLEELLAELAVHLESRYDLAPAQTVTVETGPVPVSAPPAPVDANPNLSEPELPAVDANPNLSEPELPAVDEAVQAALAETVPGRVAFNPPADMRQGATTAMEVRIVRSRELDEAITTSLRGRAAPRLEDISTSLVMAVDLIGDAFTITSYSSREQLVLTSQATSWKFDLVTGRIGGHGLAVRVSMQLPVEGQDRCHDVCVLERMVRVRVSPRYLVREHWKWGVATALPVGGAVAAWKGIF